MTALTCVLCAPVFGQYRVDPGNRGERIIVVVPMVGSGAPGDPKRPLFAPLPDEMRTSGIQEFRYQLSDDGKNAIVEFVARDRVALDKIVKDNRTVKAFEKGKDKKDDIETEMKKHKKDFTLGPIVSPVVVQPGSAQ